jgi:hypothetical protein
MGSLGIKAVCLWLKKTGKRKMNKKEIREILKKGKHQIYTLCRHVSQSGMFRLISCFVIIKNKPVCIDWYIEDLGLFKRHSMKEGLRVSGCGMDMGFHVVYSLSCAVYCNKKYNHESAYKLKQRWL